MIVSVNPVGLLFSRSLQATPAARHSVSFRYACVGWRLGCELRRMGSLSHIFREQGIHLIADPVTEVVADAAYFIEPDD
jgi:hypothetical protein